VLRRVMLSAARSDKLGHLVEHAPVSRGIVARFVAGTGVDDALAAASRLVDQGLLVSVDRLGEATTDRESAATTADAYVALLADVERAGLAASVEVSLKLSSLGQALPDGDQLALEHAHRICAAAQAAGTTVTIDMEDHTTTDATLAAAGRLRADFPHVGAVVQAYLRRSEGDCRELASAGARVRLCKGAYREPASVAFQGKADVDLAYVRCLRVLLRGAGYPMIATHDLRLLSIAGVMAQQAGRGKDRYEYQMLYGVRPEEQARLAGRGERVRVYVPYGDQWYPYLMRRMAERPANLMFFLRAVASRPSRAEGE
jgi:proline dehydrogenase